MSLEGKSVLVTGASRGIGRAIAVAAAEGGSKLTLTARSEAGLAETAAAVKAAGGSAEIVTGDAGDASDIARAVDAAVSAHGGLDVLINNAGMIEPIARIEAATAADWARAMQVNLIGPVLFTKAALPHLRAAHGCIVNVSSGAAHRPLEGWPIARPRRRSG